MRLLIKHKRIVIFFISFLAILGMQAGNIAFADISCPNSGTPPFVVKGVSNNQVNAAERAQLCAGHTKNSNPTGATTLNCPDGTTINTTQKDVSSGAASCNTTSTDNPKCAGPSGTGTAPAGYDCIYQKYLIPLGIVLSALVGIAVVMGIIIGGIQYSTSGGDPQKVATAKAHITKALIALIVYFFLYAILQFIVPGGVRQ